MSMADTPPSRLPLLLAPSLVVAALATALAADVFGHDRPWQLVLLLPLLMVGAIRLGLTATGALLGLVPRRTIPVPPLDPRPPRRARTALLLPIYNEPSGPIATAVGIMAGTLRPGDRVTVFLLSDTQDPVRAAEEAALFPACATSPSGVEVRYRRRANNIGRKAGNIAAFCAEHGAAFDYAIVLDADSLMTGASIRALIRSMADDPAAALIQTVSYPIGGRTLFARMQQFGARLNTPTSVAGLDLWQGRRGTYWGHNAILRLGPFMRHGVLPVLPGRAPLGGEILCHDTVEAALLLRAGWEVRLAPDIVGSFETTPSNLIDHLARERRWAQGNLQHMRLLAAPGLCLESRVHLGMGVLYYLAAPMGLALSLLLLADGLTGALAGPAPAASAALLWSTLLLLFGPRLAVMATALAGRGVARGFGGRMRLLASVLAELVGGTLVSPIVAVSVTGFVAATLAGRVVPWTTQPRGDRPVGWTEAWRHFRVHTLLGAGLLATVLAIRPMLVPWTLPFVVGLILAVPLAVWSGSVRLGRGAGRAGLFLTTDELWPLPEQAALYPQAGVDVEADADRYAQARRSIGAAAGSSASTSASMTTGPGVASAERMAGLS